MNTLTSTQQRRPDHDEDWRDVAAAFQVRPGTTYLNHGSFGISPVPVRVARQAWIERLDQQPMDFFVRHHEPIWRETIDRLGDFLGTSATNLVFADNATFAMNIVADSFPLEAGDTVLSNNHEYGAVHRIWERRCQRQGATLTIAEMPDRFESHDQIVDAIFARADASTRLLILSHITSPTALIMPVAAVCAEARKRGIAVCIDGPHAPAHVELNIDVLDCDFYCASLHKWLAAPLGTGFLYVHPRWHPVTEPQQMSWGRMLPAVPETWQEEFIWPGTRDFSGYFSIPAAIDFMESVGLEAFRERTRWMKETTTRRLMELTGQEPIGTDTELWYGTMAHVPLPPGDWSDLQQWLWNEHGIEVPVIQFNDRWFIRVSHHLYTTTDDIDKLLTALRTRM